MIEPIDVSTPPDRLNYRVRAVLHHDDGLSHPDVGRLVALDRRLSYHRTEDLASARRDKIQMLDGSTLHSECGTSVKWVEVSRRYGSNWEVLDKAHTP